MSLTATFDEPDSLSAAQTHLKYAAKAILERIWQPPFIRDIHFRDPADHRSAHFRKASTFTQHAPTPGANKPGAKGGNSATSKALQLLSSFLNYIEEACAPSSTPAGKSASSAAGTIRKKYPWELDYG